MVKQVNNVLVFELERFFDVINSVPDAAVFYSVPKMIMKWKCASTHELIEKR